MLPGVAFTTPDAAKLKRSICSSRSQISAGLLRSSEPTAGKNWRKNAKDCWFLLVHLVHIWPFGHIQFALQPRPPLPNSLAHSSNRLRSASSLVEQMQGARSTAL